MPLKEVMMQKEYKTKDKDQPVNAQADTPTPKLKIKSELIYSQKTHKVTF